MPQLKDKKAWLHKYACLVAASTAFLLYAGAMVTSTGSGLAVPDWPLSFGMVFPPMVGGVFYEHGHRMVAGVVAFLTLLLLIAVLRWETRKTVRTLTVVAAGAVLVQAGLGGATVLLKLPPQVSILHTVLGQSFFCFTVLIALLTSDWWFTERRPVSSTSLLPWTSAFLSLLFFGQLVLGAMTRHYRAGLAIPDFPTVFGGWYPTEFTFQIAIHFAHRMGAYSIFILSCLLAFWVYKKYQAETSLVTLSGGLVGLLMIQILLGSMVIWMRRPIEITSLHLLIGAFCLACSLCLSTRLFYLRRVEAVRFIRPIAVPA